MQTIINLLHPSVFSNLLLKGKKKPWSFLQNALPSFSKKKYEDIRKRYSCSEPIRLDIRAIYTRKNKTRLT